MRRLSFLFSLDGGEGGEGIETGHEPVQRAPQHMSAPSRLLSKLFIPRSHRGNPSESDSSFSVLKDGCVGRMEGMALSAQLTFGGLWLSRQCLTSAIKRFVPTFLFMTSSRS